MTIKTERLELYPLTAGQLKLLVEDISLLEKEFNCIYQAEPMKDFFLEIVKGQLAATEKDEVNYIWHSFWLIVRKSDRIVVGLADFKDVPNKDHEVEIGYGLGKKFEHFGYMTETVKAMSEWAKKQDGVDHVIAETDADGIASQSVLKRCGFTEYAHNETSWWRF